MEPKNRLYTQITRLLFSKGLLQSSDDLRHNTKFYLVGMSTTLPYAKWLQLTLAPGIFEAFTFQTQDAMRSSKSYTRQGPNFSLHGSWQILISIAENYPSKVPSFPLFPLIYSTFWWDPQNHLLSYGQNRNSEYLIHHQRIRGPNFCPLLARQLVYFLVHHCVGKLDIPRSRMCTFG